MEFLLLPLLVRVGLRPPLDGGDDTAGAGAEPGDNDRLAGSGTDRVFGGEGDDDLTLTDEATGFDGVGNDTIRASGNATGFGLDGDDSLLGRDTATVMGGAGDDMLVCSAGAVVSSPEAGAGIHVLDQAAGGGNPGFGYQSRDAGDRFALHLGSNDLSAFRFSVTSGSEDGASGPDGDITELTISETLADGTTADSVLSFRGVCDLNLRGIIW